MPRDPSQANTATLQVNEEQYVVCHQAAPAQHFDGEEIDAGQIPVWSKNSIYMSLTTMKSQKAKLRRGP
jgi:hypothetical protein